jgi:putative iron-dependent peroxidase
LTFRLAPGGDARAALGRVARGFAVESGVVGLGAPLVRAVGGDVPGLRGFAALAGPGCSVPSTQQAMWMLLRGADRGALFDATQQVLALLEGAFDLDDALDTFVYAGGRDLTGYEDGTENPRGEAAIATALVAAGEHLAGSSFVSVQRWVHDLPRFRSFPPRRRDEAIGRERESNDELDDAPASAHVKRTAQESFEPPAFMLRRSMPWAAAREQGLEFIAFGASLDAFEASMRRMAGLDDGIVDALFSFSRPVTGGAYWCPPAAGGRLDLTRAGV